MSASTMQPIPPPIYSPFLDEQSTKIAAKVVPWEGYQRAKLVSTEEVSLLKALDKTPRSQLPSLFSTQGQTYATLYLTLLGKLTRLDTIQAVLVAVHDMIKDGSNLSYFHGIDGNEVYQPLVKCLGIEDEFSVLASLRILAILIGTDTKPFPQPIIAPLLASLSSLANANSSPPRDLAIQVLDAFVNNTQFRQAVWTQGEAISGLIKALKANPSPQVQYWVLVCIWQLTFEKNIAEGIDKRYDLIAVLTETAKSAVKEKVTRVAVATYKNLLALAPTQNLPSMLVHKILAFVVSLQGRKWSDDEVTEDLAYLKDELKQRLDGLSTYDEYASEVESGHLTWSPAHDSDEFWKENWERIGTENDGKGVKRLVHLLKTSEEPVVLAVAAHDLAQFVKYGGDRGKKTINDLGAKTRVMELMTHANADVRYQALVAVQRLLSQGPATGAK